MKICKRCKSEKENNDFYITKVYEFSNTKYYDSVCKKCRNKERHQEKIEETRKEKIKKWNNKFKELWKDERTL